MKAWKMAGLALAVGACVFGFAGWQASSRDNAYVTPPDSVATTSAPARLALPAGATQDSPQPLALDAALARSAVQEGELRIALADGNIYPIRIQRQYTDSLGRWNVVGRADTEIGTQSMVLTFGAKAVFGIIPQPDGRLLQVSSGRNGVVVAPAGNMITDPRAGDATDYLVPPRTPHAVAAAAPSVPRAQAHAAQRDRVASPTGIATVAPVARVQAAADTATPVTIDVLALYSNELVSELGSQDAAETKVASMFASANSAHAASGTGITLNPVRLVQITDSPNLDNKTTLQLLTDGTSLDVESMRDANAADLVAYVRPQAYNDVQCGASWLQSPGLGRDMFVDQEYAYAVVSSETWCDPYALAHEFGHLMGSMHDRPQSTDAVTGELHHGAFAFSFGHRTSKFATIMALPYNVPRIGQFSDSDSNACRGAPCGIADRADDVRSLKLMAPAIAKFRDPVGSASAGDVQMLEPAEGRNQLLFVPVHAVLADPMDVAEFDFEVVGGTATRDVDYTIDTTHPTGMTYFDRVAYINIQVIGDDEVEGDETIQLHVTSRDGIATVVDGDVTATIVDDDPRSIITGKLWFQPGVARPLQSTKVYYTGAEGFDDDTEYSLTLAPPDFAYSIAVPRGSPLRFYNYGGGDFSLTPTALYEVEGDRELPLMYRSGWTLSGQLKVAPGSTMPSSAYTFQMQEIIDGETRTYRTVQVGPPDWRYSVKVAAGATADFSAGPSGAYGSFRAVREYIYADQTMDLVLGAGPSIWVTTLRRPGMGPRLTIHTAQAPASYFQFNYRMVDGTAKAGDNYFADASAGTINSGELSTTLDVTTFDVDGGPKYFDVIFENIKYGPNPTPIVHRVWVADKDLRTGGGLRPGSQ